jgi:hypothetical protein
VKSGARCTPVRPAHRPQLSAMPPGASSVDSSSWRARWTRCDSNHWSRASPDAAWKRRIGVRGVTLRRAASCSMVSGSSRRSSAQCSRGARLLSSCRGAASRRTAPGHGADMERSPAVPRAGWPRLANCDFSYGAGVAMLLTPCTAQCKLAMPREIDVHESRSSMCNYIQRSTGRVIPNPTSHQV